MLNKNNLNAVLAIGAVFIAVSTHAESQLSSTPDAGALLATGNYKALNNESRCDLHVESNSISKKIFLTNIANQRSGQNCESGETAIFDCDDQGICTRQIPAISMDDEDSENQQTQTQTITIVNKYNFISPRNIQFTFTNNKPILPATSYSASATFGFIGIRGSSFTGSSQCIVFANDGTYACDDKNIVEKNFCPKARDLAAKQALSDCKKATGKSCSVTDVGTQQIIAEHSDGIWNSRFGGYDYPLVYLYCGIEKLTAKPNSK